MAEKSKDNNLKSECLKKTYRHRHLRPEGKNIIEEVETKETIEQLSIEEIVAYKNEIYNELIKVANAFYGRYESFAEYIEEDERKKFIDELVKGCEPYEFYPKEMFETFIDLTIEYIDKYCPKSDLVFYSIKKLAECTGSSGDGKFDNCTMGIMMRFLKEDDGRIYTLVKKFEEKYDSLDGKFNSIQFHNSIVHSIDSFLLKRGIPCFSTQKKREQTKRELFMLRTYAHNFMRKLISESQEN